MNTITTTCQITFGSGADHAHLSAEVDVRPEGLNKGKTSFTGGEPVYILVYKSKNVRILKTLVSAGSIHPAESQLVSVEDTLTFADKKEASLSKPAAGPVTSTWYGNSLGGLGVGEDQITITASSSGVAVCKVRYGAQAQAYRLSTPVELAGAKNFNILFFVAGVAE